jgi:hypothetical protein
VCLPCARTAMHSALSPPYTRSLWAQPLGGVGVWRYWAMEGRASGWCSSRVAASAPVGRGWRSVPVRAAAGRPSTCCGPMRRMGPVVGLGNRIPPGRGAASAPVGRVGARARAAAGRPSTCCGQMRRMGPVVGLGNRIPPGRGVPAGAAVPEPMLNDPPGSPPQ